MNRRNLLRVLPLAAMVGATVKLGETEAQAFEMKPDKKYMFVISSDLSSEQAQRYVESLRKRGVDAIVCAGNVAANMKIYELE